MEKLSLNFRTARRLLIPCILALAPQCPARLIRHPDRPQCNPTTIGRADIRNFHQVDNELYRGAHPACGGYRKLAALGVRTIIDLEGGSEKRLRECEGKRNGGASIEFIPYNISLYEITVSGVTDESVIRLFEIIARAAKPIFINCKFGEDRTGFVVALYRMKRRELAFPEARKEALFYGFETRFRGLNQTLNRYQDAQKLARVPAPDESPAPKSSVCLAD